MLHPYFCVIFSNYPKQYNNVTAVTGGIIVVYRTVFYYFLSPIIDEMRTEVSEFGEKITKRLRFAAKKFPEPAHHSGLCQSSPCVAGSRTMGSVKQ